MNSSSPFPSISTLRSLSLADLLPTFVHTAALSTIELRLPPCVANFCIALLILTKSQTNIHDNGWFTPFQVAVRDSLLKGVACHPEADIPQEPVGDALCKMVLIDSQNWLPYYFLERGDRIWMAASLQLRLLQKATTKWLVKPLALCYSPDGIVNGCKVGFRDSLDTWLCDAPLRPRSSTAHPDFTHADRP